MYELLLAIAIVLFAMLKVREHYGLVVGTRKQLRGEDGWASYLPDLTTDTTTTKGVEVVSLYPHTCVEGDSDLNGALCYPPCPEGYTGDAGPTCRAISVVVGAGRIPQFMSCDESGYGGWTDTGLLCNEPVRTTKCKFRGLFGECWPGLTGGRVNRKEGRCTNPEFPVKITGLCYRKCPDDLPERMPAAPYSCYKGGPLVTGRGWGRIPKMIRVGRTWAFGGGS